MLFVDMVGFTGVAYGLDPEDVRALQTEYFAAIADVVHGWNGVVEKYIGDAVMAVFGVPRSDGYDAYRAVRAGMRLPEAVGRLRLPDGRPVRVRVGVATGEALVDCGPAATGGQCLVSGDVVNMAARLQAAAAPGTVAVTAGTERATRALVRYERLAPATVAGRAVPLEIWRPLDGACPEPVDDTPLVGRAAELATAAGRVAHAARHGVPQLVSIASAAGVGRSRLVRELRRYPGVGAGDGVRWLVGRCLPGGGLDRALLDMVERGPELALTRRPAVLVVEDLHWADARVDRFLRGVLAVAAAWRSPLTVLVTSRVEEAGPAPDAGLGADFEPGAPGTRGRRSAGPGPRGPGPGGLGAVGSGPGGPVPDCRIELAPLTGADTGRLLRHLLRRAGRPVGLAHRLVPLVHGNPAYAEAYVRLVVECATAAAHAELPVPDPVRAAVAVRLDRFAADERRALLAAAVLGRRVPVEALGYLLGRGAGEVRALLRRAVRSGFLVPSAEPGGEPGYAFVDPAVRAVAYGRLPRRVRIEHHRRAARWWDGRPDVPGDRAAGRVRHWLAVLGLSRLLRRDTGPYRRPVLSAIADATAHRPHPLAATGRPGRSSDAHRRRGPAPVSPRPTRLPGAARPPPADRSTACR